MIWSLSRVLTALRIELRTPSHEEGVATVARALLNPADEVAYKVTNEGLRDTNGADPFKRKRPVVLIDNENSITLTSEQSGALVIPKLGLPSVGDVLLPSDPEDGDYFTIATRAVGSIFIQPNGHLVGGFNGEVSDILQTELTTGTVTLVFSEDDGIWHITHLNGTYTIVSGA